MPTSTPPTRVAIVDDDADFRDGLVATFESLAHVSLVGVAATVREAKLLIDKKPEVFFIDLALPDGSGLELISWLKERLPDCKPIILSVFGDVEHVVRGIELGADGYLLKDSGLSQAAQAISMVLEGGAPLSPAVARHILRRVQTAPRKATKTSSISLTPRETTTLEAMARGYTIKELATVLGISHHTVGDHVKSIYRKLQVNSRTEAVFEATQQGLIHPHT